MKYVLRLSLAAIFGILLFSCSNELDVIEASRDIPVVYGFLSMTQDTQFLRIERAFIDKDIPASDLAQNLDNLYYGDDVKVSIINLDNTEVHLLEKVDASQVGYVREEGIFLTEPNILYQIASNDLNLDPDSNYQLEIERTSDDSVVTAQTKLVGECRIIRPRPTATPRVVDFSPIAPTPFRWNSGDNASIYDVALEINYQERLPNEEYVVKKLLWNMGTNINDNGESTQQHLQEADGFYNFLSNNIEVNSQMSRIMRDFRVIVTAGSIDLQKYLKIGQANLGITSTQDIPFHSNLSEGRGIFASTYETILDGVQLSPGSLDSLFNGSETKDLNFFQ